MTEIRYSYRTLPSSFWHVMWRARSIVEQAPPHWVLTRKMVYPILNLTRSWNSLLNMDQTTVFAQFYYVLCGAALSVYCESSCDSKWHKWYYILMSVCRVHAARQTRITYCCINSFAPLSHIQCSVWLEFIILRNAVHQFVLLCAVNNMNKCLWAIYRWHCVVWSSHTEYVCCVRG